MCYVCGCHKTSGAIIRLLRMKRHQPTRRSYTRAAKCRARPQQSLEVIDQVRFLDLTGRARTVFSTWEDILITVDYECEGAPPAETLGLAIGIAYFQIGGELHLLAPARQWIIKMRDHRWRLPVMGAADILRLRRPGRR